MKKIGLIVKETFQNRINDGLKNSDSVMVVKYSGLSSPDLTVLRRNLKSSRADLFVVKNSVARRALKGSSVEPLVEFIEGPCAVIFIKEEPVAVSKVLFNFIKEHEQLKFAGGCLKDKILGITDIETMAKLPAKEVLRAQAVIALNAPIQKLVMALKYTISKLVICLDQIKSKKGS